MTIEPCSALQRDAKVIRTAAAGRNSDKKSMLDAAPSSSIPNDGCRTEKEERRAIGVIE